MVMFGQCSTAFEKAPGRTPHRSVASRLETKTRLRDPVRGPTTVELIRRYPEAHVSVTIR